MKLMAQLDGKDLTDTRVAEPRILLVGKKVLSVIDEEPDAVARYTENFRRRTHCLYGIYLATTLTRQGAFPLLQAASTSAA